jgi:hypothetical protein
MGGNFKNELAKSFNYITKKNYFILYIFNKKINESILLSPLLKIKSI